VSAPLFIIPVDAQAVSAATIAAIKKDLMGVIEYLRLKFWLDS
jgi:hypothetical protein